MTAVVLTSLLATLIAQTSGKPSDFSGVWVQDNAKSVLMDESPRDVQLSIVDSGKSVKVVRSLKTSNPKIPGGWFEAETYTSTTDGKPSEQRIPDLHYSRLLARDGRDLMWRITLTRASDGGVTTFSERWSLSDDGKLLTILRTYRDGREVTQVFVRKR
ncbi:MAG: hypothetical protein ACM4AI_25370 [Acidobacteriota bacterium]